MKYDTAFVFSNRSDAVTFQSAVLRAQGVVSARLAPGTPTAAAGPEDDTTTVYVEQAKSGREERSNSAHPGWLDRDLGRADKGLHD